VKQEEKIWKSRMTPQIHLLSQCQGHGYENRRMSAVVPRHTELLNINSIYTLSDFSFLNNQCCVHLRTSLLISYASVISHGHTF
jgi:hypothetical protein